MLFSVSLFLFQLLISPDLPRNSAPCVTFRDTPVLPMTVRALIRQDKKDSKGLVPISICITVNRKRSYQNTGTKVHPDYWDGSKVMKGYPNADIINAKVSSDIAALQRSIIASEMQGRALTLNMAKTLLKGDQGNAGLIGYGQALIDGIGNAGTKRRYQVELEELLKYAGKVSFGDVTPVFLTKYYAHLTKTKSHNTAINAFKFIRLTFNHAIAHGVTTLYPFKDWKYPRYQATQKLYLTIEECDRIWERILQPDVSPEFRLVGVFFCLECFSGLRVSDWGKFSVERVVSNDELYLRTTKTGVEIRLPLDLMPRLKRTVDYIKSEGLVWTYTGEHANRILKLIAPLAKVSKRITTHTGRHSFAVHMLGKGMSREAVAEMLGVSMKIIDTYAKFSPDKLRNELTRVGGI